MQVEFADFRFIGFVEVTTWIRSSTKVVGMHYMIQRTMFLGYHTTTPLRVQILCNGWQNWIQGQNACQYCKEDHILLMDMF